MRDRRSVRLLAALTLLAGIVLFPSAEALAACPSGEENIFVADHNGSGLRTNARGTWNMFQIRSRPINIDCSTALDCNQSNPPDVRGYIGSTAHLRLGGATGDWVEVGWVGFRHSNGTRDYCWFTEWGINSSSIQGVDIGALPSWAGLNDTPKFRVTNVPGTLEWNLYIDCVDFCPAPGHDEEGRQLHHQ
jgi:hypothetical protein